MARVGRGGDGAVPQVPAVADSVVVPRSASGCFANPLGGVGKLHRQGGVAETGGGGEIGVGGDGDVLGAGHGVRIAGVGVGHHQGHGVDAGLGVLVGRVLAAAGASVAKGPVPLLHPTGRGVGEPDRQAGLGLTGGSGEAGHRGHGDVVGAGGPAVSRVQVAAGGARPAVQPVGQGR